MKGVVFTEFLGLVEEHFSADMVDDIIDDAHLPHGGAYTAVGTYPHEEIVAMVVALSKRSGVPARDLVRLFGEHLFTRFVAAYPSFFADVHSAFDFLNGIEDIIHAEVLKLYPDAQLPRFEIESRTDDRMSLIYASPRHFEDLAEGLMRGCVAHFAEPISVTREDTLADGRQRFVLLREAVAAQAA